MGAAVGIWSLLDQRNAAKASERRAEKAMFSSAAATGRAEAKENANFQAIGDARAKEAQNPELDEAARLSKRKRGVQSTYMAAGGSGAGMMKGTSLTPIGGGDTGAIGAV